MCMCKHAHLYRLASQQLKRFDHVQPAMPMTDNLASPTLVVLIIV